MDALIAFAIALVLTPVAAWVAHRAGVVDRPAELKVQDRPVAYLGGLAVALAIAAPVARADPALLVPLGLALGLGLADDVADLPAGARLAVEIGIGAVAASVVTTGGVLGDVGVAVLVVGLINAVNLLDGLDGLASSVGVAGALGLAVIVPGDDVLALALAGALVGFLVHNRPPASIYLGDAGAYLVGTALALSAASTLAPGAPGAWAAGAALCVAVPVADTAVAVVRRARSRSPLLVGDRGHVYDQLRDRGQSVRRVVVTLALVQVVLAAAGAAIAELTAGPAFAAAAVVTVAGASVIVSGGFLRTDAGDASAG